MCGIIGYVGKRNAWPILLNGLRRLEYRGYDSAGIAVISGSRVISHKAVGRINNLVKKTQADKRFLTTVGIAHTRWATHGKPTVANAHPHTDCFGRIWVVHNGIIENYAQLKRALEKRGHKFSSQTDTEVIAHLLEEVYQGDLTAAVLEALKMLKGAYGLIVLHIDEPEKLVAAKLGSPLLVGIGQDEVIITSDAAAVIDHTKDVIYLEDAEVAEVSRKDVSIIDLGGRPIKKEVRKIDWDIDQAGKEGFAHFMLKEICEQPQTVKNAILGRLLASKGEVKLGGLEDVAKRLRNIKRLVIVGCGTAYCAGLVGEYLLEELTDLAVEVEFGSEFRYRTQTFDPQTAVLVISQSGETADTLAAVKQAKAEGLLTLGIINVVGSSIARETDAGVYTRSGPEIAVASTKVFTAQVSVLALYALFWAQIKGLNKKQAKAIARQLAEIPGKIEAILAEKEHIKRLARRYSRFANFAFMGRKFNYPLALEGAIKLKEVSYIHAEGFASGEMKHGPIAMIDKNFPSIFIMPRDSVYGKNLANMEEIKARGGKVIAIASRGDRKIERVADDVIYIPQTLEPLYPLLTVIPLQLFAYYAAIARGLDVDKPRNLAKSVTVE